MRTRPQDASAPSLLVMPLTASAVSSAAAARAISCSAVGSVASNRSSGPASRGGSKASGRPPKGSSGTIRAIATARSASMAKPRGSGSVEETIAWRLPTKTRRPRSKPSARSSCSIRPRRRETDSEAFCTSSASAASAPARFAAATRSERRSRSFMDALPYAPSPARRRRELAGEAWRIRPPASPRSPAARGPSSRGRAW